MCTCLRLNYQNILVLLYVNSELKDHQREDNTHFQLINELGINHKSKNKTKREISDNFIPRNGTMSLLLLVVYWMTRKMTCEPANCQDTVSSASCEAHSLSFLSNSQLL